jgi:hypothetical protein
MAPPWRFQLEGREVETFIFSNLPWCIQMPPAEFDIIKQQWVPAVKIFSYGPETQMTRSRKAGRYIHSIVSYMNQFAIGNWEFGVSMFDETYVMGRSIVKSSLLIANFAVA